MKLTLVAAATLALATPLQATALAQPAVADSANGADRNFVTEAIAGGNQEILQARSELKSSPNPSVKLFAQTMIHDHTEANNRIATVARGLGLPVLNWPLIQMALPGAQPASTYMRDEVAAHQHAIALFKAEAGSGSRPLAAEAGQILPILESHLEMAQHYLQTAPGS
jgi:putative membrane protein